MEDRVDELPLVENDLVAVSATAVVILLVYSAALSPQLPWALSRAIQAWQQA